MGEGYCLQLDIQDYDHAWQLQRQLAAARRRGQIPDTLLVLEHFSCYTIGRQGGFEHILAGPETLKAKGIKVYETDRGGDITYHGPGQLVCYPIFDLQNHGCDLYRMARRLETVMIGTLADFGISGNRKHGFPGVWAGENKIGFMGLAVQSWVTSHGISLNVNPDLNHFSLIIPCGLSGCRVTSMEEVLGRPVEMAEVRSAITRQFAHIFGMRLQPVGVEEVEVMAVVDG